MVCGIWWSPKNHWTIQWYALARTSKGPKNIKVKFTQRESETKREQESEKNVLKSISVSHSDSNDYKFNEKVKEVHRKVAMGRANSAVHSVLCV